jgi:patatin-like phospholipase/acyl hydrolase
MLDAFNSGKISEEGLVKRIYKILESRGLLDAIITKVLMDYTNKNKTSTDVSFNNELTELEDEELEDADE